jgi:Fe-S oxidoreductase
MRQVFAPGCALVLYKPHLARRLHAVLSENIGRIETHLTCCRHDPQFTVETEVINVCPGCDKRYRNDHEHTSTTSLWEILAAADSFPFPDYQGKAMTIIDACPTRDQERVHVAVRTLLRRMNISLIEPANTGTRSICCGDSLWGEVTTERVEEQMTRRASEMPADDVVVYCVSCSLAVRIGGKRPRYMIDLLFDEETTPPGCDLGEWHHMLDDFIAAH